MRRRPVEARAPGRAGARRRAVTLVELAVVVGLLASLFALAYALAGSAGRQGEQVDEKSALLEAALVLQESLAWDLHRALDLGVLPPEAAPRGVALGALTLPMAAGYDPTASPSRVAAPRVYRFAGGAVTRDGEPVVAEGLDEVQFAWTAEEPTELQVLLRGGGEGFVFRLPAPAGSDGAVLWRRHPRHRGARLP